MHCKFLQKFLWIYLFLGIHQCFDRWPIWFSFVRHHQKYLQCVCCQNNMNSGHREIESFWWTVLKSRHLFSSSYFFSCFQCTFAYVSNGTLFGCNFSDKTNFMTQINKCGIEHEKNRRKKT